ncbi:intracellular septation protein A [Thermocatellispora tengchongensis]|uniref:Intracellular septation protein A n=1 Tax=Thermocatellispora tengchongensis TaxID=1073253 RepID=A0A840PK65_9ACTN|nr:VC0807 family protein [Thermocatellispora tengchongensis]MBB5138313.1 intracellular septation protein A [Thermocatellispora tengchongensis]
MNHPPVTLPRLTALARQAVPRLLEGVVAPLAVFYAALALLGLNGALIAAVSWVYAGVAWRLVRRRRVPGTMVLAAIAITARALLGLWTGSAVVYFLQPELGTICISMAFLASVRLRRPLVQRLTLDYIHLPNAVLRHERVRRFFARITLLWAFVLLANSTVSIWLLLHQSIGTYLLVRTAAVAVISGLAIGVSIYAFRRVLSRLHHDAPKAITAAA